MKLVNKLTILFLLFFCIGNSQELLNCEISISKQTTSVEKVLYALEESCGISFSYNASKIPVDSIVTVEYSKEELEVVLKKLLGDEVVVLLIGSSVIIKLPSRAIKDESYTKVKVRGVIRDTRTNKKLRDVTVYSTEDLKPVLTDSAGVFEIELDPRESATLLVYKEDYIDTLIVVSNYEDSAITTPLELSISKHFKEQFDSLTAQIEDLKIVKWLTTQDFKTHAKNFGDAITSNNNYQVSFVPGISSNGLMNSSTSTPLSFNLISGYTGAVSKFELGGVLNIIKKDLDGFQVAGFSNIVGGKVDGVQLAGFSNLSLTEMNGTQVSGFLNLAKGKSKGAQLSGFLNISMQEQNGIQLAGFVNFCPKDITSAQISGFVNYGKNLNGVQLAGYINVAGGETKGGQLAGFLNVSLKDVEGVQIAGMHNHSRGWVKGVQIAPLNYAKKLKGVQLGVFNIVSDSISGVPIGLFTIAPKGYTRVQLEYSPTIIAKASFISGVKSFYNLVSIGYVEKDRYSIGYGIGSGISLGEYVGVNFQLSADQFTKDFRNNEIDLNTRFASGLSLKLGKRFEIFGSYNLNLHAFKNGISIGSDLYQSSSEGINLSLIHI